MLLQRHASKACARKMLALSRPKIAVTVSIIVVVPYAPPAQDRMGIAQSKRFRRRAGNRSPADDSGQQFSRSCHICPGNQGSGRAKLCNAAGVCVTPVVFCARLRGRRWRLVRRSTEWYDAVLAGSKPSLNEAQKGRELTQSHPLGKSIELRYFTLLGRLTESHGGTEYVWIAQECCAARRGTVGAVRRSVTAALAQSGRLPIQLLQSAECGERHRNCQCFG
jgi:hypothetical protein